MLIPVHNAMGPFQATPKMHQNGLKMTIRFKLRSKPIEPFEIELDWIGLDKREMAQKIGLI